MMHSRMRGQGARPPAMRFHGNNGNAGGGFQYGRGRGYKHSVHRSPHNNGTRRSLSPVGHRMASPLSTSRYRSRSPISSQRSFSPQSQHSSRLRRNHPLDTATAVGEPRRAPVQPAGRVQGSGRPRSSSVQSLSPPSSKQSRSTVGVFHGPWGTVLDRSDMKKITVDIKRHIPKEKRSTSPVIRRIINSDAITVYRRSGEGVRPLFARAELADAVNQRFDKAAVAPQNEPRMVAIIRDPTNQRAMATNMGSGRSEHIHSPIHMGAQRYIGDEKEHVEDGAHYNRQGVMPKRAPPNNRFSDMAERPDRKFHQLQRYEQKFRESFVADEVQRSSAGAPMRKMADKDVRQRLGFRRPQKDERMEPGRGRDYDNFDMRAEGKQPMWHNDEGRYSTMDFRNRDRFGHSSFRGRGGRGRDYQQW